MTRTMSPGFNALIVVALLLVLLPSQVHAFGAGNIASISAVEGKNWRHGDIEDMLKTIAFIKGHKWTSMMVKRVYFGNWLRDYSQAMDVGTLKNLPADTIRILVWILSFLTFGYATAEFEVTSDRLGVYRPEEHIDNPKDYADNQDARQYDARLRGPIRQVELDIDPQTGMKNYIANERGDWTTSTAYIKYSLARSIHYGRLYTSGGHNKGKEEDLCEALRCLGQGLHTLEDFAAHTNYCELALREMGFRNVFPHTGAATEMNIRGHRVFPLVTGTFGMVDFFHSVLGEATDHFTQSEVNEMDIALGDAQANSSGGSLSAFTGLLGKIPGTKDLVDQAGELKRRSEAQQYANEHSGQRSGYVAHETSRGLDDYGSATGRDLGESLSRASGPSQPSTSGGPAGPGLPGMPDFDPKKTVAQIYPILEFRDNVVRKLSSIIEKIPGLETLVEKVTETLTVFVMSLLAPFIRPIISAASNSLQAGSAGVIDASGQHQFEPWTNPHCTDPTHSMLSKDHFSNTLNEPAGRVASAILTYVAPRVLYAWEHPEVPEQQVLDDCLHVFHHPALRDMHNEAHRTMFEAVQNWAHSRPDRGANLNDILSSEGVRAGKNNGGQVGHSHASTGFATLGGNKPSHATHQQPHPQQQPSSSLPWDQLSKLPIPGISKLSKLEGAFSSFLPGSSSREERAENVAPQHQAPFQDQQPDRPYQSHGQQPYESHSQPHRPQHDQPPAQQHPGGGYGEPHSGYQSNSYGGQYGHPPPGPGYRPPEHQHQQHQHQQHQQHQHQQHQHQQHQHQQHQHQQHQHQHQQHQSHEHGQGHYGYPGSGYDNRYGSGY